MRPDPFAWCRRQGIQVLRRPGARRWFTAHVLGAIVVVVNAELTVDEQLRALAEALLAHPIALTAVSRT